MWLTAWEVSWGIKEAFFWGLYGKTSAVLTHASVVRSVAALILGTVLTPPWLSDQERPALSAGSWVHPGFCQQTSWVDSFPGVSVNARGMPQSLWGFGSSISGSHAFLCTPSRCTPNNPLECRADGHPGVGCHFLLNSRLRRGGALQLGPFHVLIWPCICVCVCVYMCTYGCAYVIMSQIYVRENVQLTGERPGRAFQTLASTLVPH